MQVGATSALGLADACRDDREAHMYWIRAALTANERTRIAMIERGVTMFTRTERAAQ